MTANIKVETRVNSIPELLQLVRELARKQAKFSVEPTRITPVGGVQRDGWMVTREELA